MAFTLAGLFLSIFSYFILLFYFQAKKPEQMKQVLETFLLSCRETLPIPEGEMEHHLSIAHALLKLFHYLQGFEKTLYPLKLPGLPSRLESFSKFYHLEDVFQFKQLLIEAAIEEHYAQIRISPTDLEVHASLANTYITLSKHLLQTKRQLEIAPFYKFRFRKILLPLETEFRKASERAVEEYKILHHYVPEDPWVHMQLAKSYETLDMKQEEMQEYETLQRLLPKDTQILKRLGILYFQQGLNAKGLIAYEELKKKAPSAAEALLSYYGCFQQKGPLEE